MGEGGVGRMPYVVDAEGVIALSNKVDTQDLVTRQLDELAAVGYTGRVVIHMRDGEVCRMVLEGVVLVGGEQLWTVVPVMGGGE